MHHLGKLCCVEVWETVEKCQVYTDPLLKGGNGLERAKWDGVQPSSPSRADLAFLSVLFATCHLTKWKKVPVWEGSMQTVGGGAGGRCLWSLE